MTQTTSPDNIPSPDLSDQYAVTQDFANLADGVQLALERRANLYKGTSTQRTAFTSAPEGVHWQDTNGAKAEYVRQSGQWVSLLSESGLVDLTSSLVTAYRGTLHARRFGSVVELLYTAPPSTSFANGAYVVVGTLPAAWRPAGAQVRREAAWFAGINQGFGYVIPSSGALGLVQSTGAARTGAEVNLTYFV